MTFLYDKSLLLCYCLGTCFFLEADPFYVLFFFLSVGLSAARYAWGIPLLPCKRQSIFFFLLGLYGFSILLFPRAMGFLPLLAYDCLDDTSPGFRKSWRLLLPGGLILTGLYRYPLSYLYYLEAGVVLAGILYYKTSALEILRQKYKKVRDDSTEQNLSLQEKNRVLLEKQDYEIYAATLKERNRIAREIHDNVGHMLSRSILMVGALRTISGESAMDTSLVQLEQTLNQAMNNIRESVHDLHDESINLREAAASCVEDFHYCPVSMEYDMGQQVPVPVKYCLLSILKESLSNIARHSQATEARIIMREHPAMYQLIIRDNGSGGSAACREGIGLSNMEERVRILNGTIRFQRKEGFQIFITIPKPELKDSFS